jgi:fibronectin type 3 domain-containing protein
MESANPAAFATYAVQVLNRERRSAGPSNQVQVSLVHTLASPHDFRAEVTKQGIVLSWTGEIVSIAPTDLHYVYRVYRYVQGSNERALIAEFRAGSDTNFSVTDANIEWENTYGYRSESVTWVQRPDKSRLEVEGDDTPELKVFAHDLFPPTVPAELQAVFSGPGQKAFIDLVWAPVMEADLAGYNVYRRQEGTAPVKLNGELVKTPAYRDEHVTGGTKYFYSVAAVDVRGNESARSEEASEEAP